MASFVDPRRVPQMAGAEEVVATIGPCPGVVRAGLALNERGYDRLLATGLDEVRFAFGVTESFNQRNQGAAVEDSIAAARRIAARARGDGVRCAVTLSVAFGCPFEGEVDPERVRRDRSERGRGRARRDHPGRHHRRRDARPPCGRSSGASARSGRRSAGHFHNTRNTGYANALAALEAGATVLDASVGGLGGCPFAPDATGNIATEDLVYLLEREGVRTGIELGRLIDVGGWLAELLGRRLDGQLYRAGRFPPAADELTRGGQDPCRAPRRARARRPDRAARPRRRPRGTSSSSRPRARSGCSPFDVSSMNEPSLPCSGPEIVPDAKRSPVAIAAPFTVA